MSQLLNQPLAFVRPPLAVREIYRFAGFELDLSASELRRDDRVLALTMKSFRVLVYLIEHRDRTVSRAELAASVWPNISVGAGSLSQAVWEIRETLEDNARRPKLIQTLRGRGYRFLARLE